MNKGKDPIEEAYEKAIDFGEMEFQKATSDKARIFILQKIMNWCEGWCRRRQDLIQSWYKSSTLHERSTGNRRLKFVLKNNPEAEVGDLD